MIKTAFGRTVRGEEMTNARCDQKVFASGNLQLSRHGMVLAGTHNMILTCRQSDVGRSFAKFGMYFTVHWSVAQLSPLILLNGNDALGFRKGICVNHFMVSDGVKSCDRRLPFSASQASFGCGV